MALAMSQSSPLPPHIHQPSHQHVISPSTATSPPTQTSSFPRHTSSSSISTSRNTHAGWRSPPSPSSNSKGKEREQVDDRSTGTVAGDDGAEDVEMEDATTTAPAAVEGEQIVPGSQRVSASTSEEQGKPSNQDADAMQVDSSPPARSSQPSKPTQPPTTTTDTTYPNPSSTKSPTRTISNSQPPQPPQTSLPQASISSSPSRPAARERTSSTAEALRGAMSFGVDRSPSKSTVGGPGGVGAGGMKSPERTRTREGSRVGSISGTAGNPAGEVVVADRRPSATASASTSNRRPSASHASSSANHIPTRSRERSTSSSVVVNSVDRPPRNLNTAPAPPQSQSSQAPIPGPASNLSSSSSNSAEPATSTSNPAPPGPGRMNLVTFPTLELIRLIASLLNQIAQANDRIRREMAVSASASGGAGTRRESASSAAGGQEGSGKGMVQAGESVGSAGGDGAKSPERRISNAAGTGKAIPAGMIIPPYRPRNSHDGAKRADEGAKESRSRSGSEAPAVGAVDSPVQKSVHKTPTSPASTPPESGSAANQTQIAIEGDAADDGHGAASGETIKPSIRPSEARPEPSSRSSSSTGVPQMQGAPPAAPPWPTTSAARHAVIHPASLLCFHARNVPSIGIEAYLQRILKYCPVTNEVFLSLLVYFDRMSKKLVATANGLAGAGLPTGTAGSGSGGTSEMDLERQKGFAIDSYNVHRLVIAGITVSSKFHSDVFYTNSRYAKVGGLPQTELNQLELQFLLLNDFGLMIKVEEMQRYADSLLMYGQNPAGSVSAALAATQQKSHQS